MSVKIGLKYIEIWNESMEDAVLEYEKQEIKKGQIVFYGPSNFTRWSKKWDHIPMDEALLGKSGAKCVINRGFGSTCAEHQLYYYPRMIKPLEPKVLVYSFSGNGASFGYSIEESWEIAQRVIAYARTDFPDIQIYLCGFNPSYKDPNAAQIASHKRFHSWLKAFCEETPNCHFIDILACEEIATRKDIYVEDKVHFNQMGYDIYTEIFKEALKDELAKY